MLSGIPEKRSKDAWIAATGKQEWEASGPTRLQRHVSDPGEGVIGRRAESKTLDDSKQTANWGAREREREREERERESERERKRERRDREKKREREREGERERKREREVEREMGRERGGKREREREHIRICIAD